MSDSLPITIEVVDQWDMIPTGRTIPLRLALSLPPGAMGSVRVPFMRHLRTDQAELNLDLFPRDICIRPGESYTLTVGTQFRALGPANLSEFYLQINPDVGNPFLAPLPDRSVRVVPDLEREVQISASRVCRYDMGVKVEVSVFHAGTTEWTDFELSVGPRPQLRSGPGCLREPRLRPGQRFTFEVVTEADPIEIEVAASFESARVQARAVYPIPVAIDRPERHAPFEFLEPRNLSHDRVVVRPEAAGADIPLARGVFEVAGDKSRYIVTVFPSRPGVLSVELLGAAGMIEVERMGSEGGSWAFLMTVVENPIFSTAARLYYDIRLADQTLRGELYFVIRPQTTRWWMLAVMAGVALTAKGAAGLTSALMNPEGAWNDVFQDGASLLSRRWTDLLQLLSIPLIRYALGLADRFSRPFEE